MNDFYFKLNVEPKEKYEKAKMAFLLAVKSVSELSDRQKYELCKELVGIEAFSAFCNMMQQYMD